MYSESIKGKVDQMFEQLREQTSSIISETATSKEASQKVTMLVSSELSTRSKTILSDMLFNLTDALMETEYFKDITRQNRFTEINLRQEILNKYQFSSDGTLDYKEASEEIRALLTGGATLVIGGAVEIGYVLITGLEFSSLVPVPIYALVVASIGAALADYFVVEPKRSRRAMKAAVNDYLDLSKGEFLGWFDEVENYFNRRVEEIKKTI